MSGPLADPDQDGLANLQEYAFALAPRTADTTADSRPTAGLSDGRLTLTFLRRRDAADLAYVIEASDDLQTWASGAGVTETVSVTPLDEERERVVVRDLASSGAATRRFLRLAVGLAP